MTWETNEPEGLVKGPAIHWKYQQCVVCGGFPADWWVLLTGCGAEIACERCMRWYFAAIKRLDE